MSATAEQVTEELPDKPKRGRPPKQEKRTRPRLKSIQIDQEKIFNRVHTFYNDDLSDHNADREQRLQRYAKFRMWVEPKDWPWEDASNIPLSDMFEKSARQQDTIHNAVMSARPPIQANSIHKQDKDKEDDVDNLIDYQVFEEQDGESMVGDAADAFVNDGVVTWFTPWVKEVKKMNDVRRFDPIPENISPSEYFRQIIISQFDDTGPEFFDGGWGAKAVDKKGEVKNIAFYTDDELRVEMVVNEMVTVFDGPKPMVMDYDDVLAPARCANLQIPGPSNSNGASHVILIDNPTVDEIRRLKNSKFYDMLTDEDEETLETLSPQRDMSQDGEEQARDDMQGVYDGKTKKSAKSHTRLTRLVCFDCFDIDGDGLDEDVIWWVILELKNKVVKASYLTEMYPGKPPRRPFSEAQYLPVRGRRVGISMLEVMEGLHDTVKALVDQGVDANTINIAPFFFYRATAGVRPEVIRMMPGEGYPVTDPQRDVVFPKMGNPSAMGFNINMITMLTQMQERAAVIGDIQFGRVPPGKSSALRTAGGLALLSGQGEARPERIMRRFFNGLADVWKQINQLNQYYLPEEKKIRLGVQPNKDPYKEIKNRQQITGEFNFTFKASALNTSKDELRQSLQIMMQTYVNELALQLGVIDGSGIYRLMRDFGKSLGGDADKYLRPPTPGADRHRILAIEAIAAIMRSEMPDGIPAEIGGAQEHLQSLVEFAQGDDFGMLQENQVQIFAEYIQTVRQLLAQEQQRQQLAAAAQLFSGQAGTDTGGRPPDGQAGDLSTPQVSGGGELIDESLPGAGGGANP